MANESKRSAWTRRGNVPAAADNPLFSVVAASKACCAATKSPMAFSAAFCAADSWWTQNPRTQAEVDGVKETQWMWMWDDAQCARSSGNNLLEGYTTGIGIIHKPTCRRNASKCKQPKRRTKACALTSFWNTLSRSSLAFLNFFSASTSFFSAAFSSRSLSLSATHAQAATYIHLAAPRNESFTHKNMHAKNTCPFRGLHMHRRYTWACRHRSTGLARLQLHNSGA